jgi:hypothetical protein
VTQENPGEFGFVGPAGILGVGLTASVWHGWSGPVLLALALSLLVLSLPITLSPLRIGFLVVGALVLPLTSLAYSRDLDHFYGLAVLLLLGAVGLLLGLHSSPNSIAMGLAVLLVIVIGSTAWTVAANPLEAFNQTPYYFGALTGPFGHRNTLGALLGIGIVPLVLLPPQGRSIEVLRWVLMGVASTLLVATQSLAPVLALAVGVLPFLVSFTARKPGRTRAGGAARLKHWWVIAMGAAGVLVAAVLVPWISQLRPTLGARFLIWQLVVGKLSDEFPLPPQSRWIDSEEAANALGFSPTHSHNALLDLFLIYGILPTIVFVTAMVGAIVTVRHLESRNWTRSNLESPVVRGVLIYMLVHSTVESMFLAGPVGALMCGVAGGLALATGGKSFAPGGAVGTKSRRKQ